MLKMSLLRATVTLTSGAAIASMPVQVVAGMADASDSMPAAIAPIMPPISNTVDTSADSLAPMEATKNNGKNVPILVSYMEEVHLLEC